MRPSFIAHALPFALTSCGSLLFTAVISFVAPEVRSSCSMSKVVTEEQDVQVHFVVDFLCVGSKMMKYESIASPRISPCKGAPTLRDLCFRWEPATFDSIEHESYRISADEPTLRRLSDRGALGRLNLSLSAGREPAAGKENALPAATSNGKILAKNGKSAAATVKQQMENAQMQRELVFAAAREQAARREFKGGTQEDVDEKNAGHEEGEEEEEEEDDDDDESGSEYQPSQL